MTREEAFALVKEKIQNQNLIKHTLAVEAVMRDLAEILNENPEIWGITGILHDIDYEETKDYPEEHSLKGAEDLKKLGLPDEITYAIKVHNEKHGLPRNSKLDKALYCADPLTGLIVAATLVLPDKKIKSLSKESVMKRYKEKSFAKGAHRETISACAELALELEDFIGLGLKSMQKIARELGL